LIYKTIIMFLITILGSGLVCASDHLLYFEAQGIAGYSSELEKMIYYSMNPEAEMQKLSIGFDYIKRFSGEYGDWGTFALQFREALVVDGEEGPNEIKWEPQVYNAYFKVKTPGPYVWIGHNRPALGLGAYLDSHGLLLRTLPIQGFGYDRDWGTGLYKDFSWGDISASLTAGSGMPLYTKGNSMSAARISYGVLSRDNFNMGLSVGYGKTLDTMGYELRNPEPLKMALASLDAAYVINRFEHRLDALAGKWLDQNTFAAMYRLGFNVDPEGLLKIEAQPTYWKSGDQDDFLMTLCFSSQVTTNLTVRLMPSYQDNTKDKRIILQLYYYRPIQ
jgi:hypothetical protein